MYVSAPPRLLCTLVAVVRFGEPSPASILPSPSADARCAALSLLLLASGVVLPCWWRPYNPFEPSLTFATTPKTLTYPNWRHIHTLPLPRDIATRLSSETCGPFPGSLCHSQRHHHTPGAFLLLIQPCHHTPLRCTCQLSRKPDPPSRRPAHHEVVEIRQREKMDFTVCHPCASCCTSTRLTCTHSDLTSTLLRGPRSHVHHLHPSLDCAMCFVQSMRDAADRRAEPGLLQLRPL